MGCDSDEGHDDDKGKGEEEEHEAMRGMTCK